MVQVHNALNLSPVASLGLVADGRRGEVTTSLAGVFGLNVESMTKKPPLYMHLALSAQYPLGGIELDDLLECRWA